MRTPPLKPLDKPKTSAPTKRMSKRLLLTLATLMITSLLFACVGQPATETETPDGDASRSQQSASSDNADSSDVAAPSQSNGGPIQEGVVAPNFAYTTIDGAASELSAHRGSVVLINLWASWCGPCVTEMPDIDRLKQQNPKLVVLAVNVSDTPTDARGYIEETGYDFTWILDKNNEIGSLYPTDGIPYTIIVDKAGTISSIYLGSPRDPLKTYGEALQKADV
jgi:thiol-disulfide isomerase/thioredoxin